jgi:hypothetical protein
MDHARAGIAPGQQPLYWLGTAYSREEDLMEDLFYVALTIVVFGVLWLIVKGIENLER